MANLVEMPVFPQGTSTEITLSTFAITQTPNFGGPVQRLSRLGDKWKIKVDMRPMRARQAGPMVAIVLRGLNEMLKVPVPQPEIDPKLLVNGTAGNAATTGRLVSYVGSGIDKQVGQYFNHIASDGIPYLYQIIGVAGSTLTIQPALKKPIAIGDQLIFDRPVVCGYLAGTSQSVSLSRATAVGISIEVQEAN